MYRLDHIKQSIEHTETSEDKTIHARTASPLSCPTTFTLKTENRLVDQWELYMYGYKGSQVRKGQIRDLYLLHVVNIIFVFKRNTTCQLDGDFASYGMFILQLLGGPCLVGL